MALTRLRDGIEESTMPRAKRISKRRKGRKSSVPALGVVGMSLSLAGGTSEAIASTGVDTPSPPLGSGREITLNEEEVADVRLATFYVFDKEKAPRAGAGVQLLGRGCGCRGCGCRGCRGCRGCGCRGCGGCGCGGCGCCPWWICGCAC